MKKKTSHYGSKNKSASNSNIKPQEYFKFKSTYRGFSCYRLDEVDHMAPGIDAVHGKILSSNGEPFADGVLPEYYIQVLTCKKTSSLMLAFNNDSLEMEYNCDFWEKSGTLYAAFYFASAMPIILEISKKKKRLNLYHGRGSVSGLITEIFNPITRDSLTAE